MKDRESKGKRMDKKYDDKLVTLLKEKQKMTDYYGAPLLIKNLPDCDEKGAMDPRLYNDMKKQLRIMAWMPSKLMRMDVSDKGITNLRKMFNAKKSIPCVEADIYVEEKKALQKTDTKSQSAFTKIKRSPKRNRFFIIFMAADFLGVHRMLWMNRSKCLWRKPVSA